MTTAQLNMLTQEVMPVLIGYVELVNAVQIGAGLQKIQFLHGLFEYMLTVEVKTGIFMRSKFKSFTALIITKIQNYRTYVLVQENEDLMKMFLTNGGKAIPKLLVIDKKTLEVLGHFGPRPQGAKQLILNYKKKFGIESALSMKLTGVLIRKTEMKNHFVVYMQLPVILDDLGN